MAKDAYTKMEAHQALIALGIPPEEARRLLAAKGGPKGADIDPGHIYYQAPNQSNSGEAELFLSYCKHPYKRDIVYNAAMCLTATARDPQFAGVEAATACGVSNIRSASFGKPMLTLDEANGLILAEIKRRLKEEAKESKK